MAPSTRLTILAACARLHASAECGTSGTCVDEATMLQLARIHRTDNQAVDEPEELWGLHAEHRAQCGSIYGQTVEVADQAECQRMATEAGHGFYTYMSLPHTNQCATHSECDVREASMPYHVYASPWPQHADHRAQCGSIYGQTVEVGDRAACQRMATEAGHDFYTYMSLPHTNQCATHSECDVREASMPYFVYARPWALHVDHRAQCGSIYRQTVEVADRAACQRMAIEAGHGFYTYMSLPHTNQCATHSECDVREASMPYHVYASWAAEATMLQATKSLLTNRIRSESGDRQRPLPTEPFIPPVWDVTLPPQPDTPVGPDRPAEWVSTGLNSKCRTRGLHYGNTQPWCDTDRRGHYCWRRVQNKEECEALAASEGHPFYSFNGRRNSQLGGYMCRTVAVCDPQNTNARNSEWETFTSDVVSIR